MSDGDLFGHATPDRQQVINELIRELEMRESVYPRWIKTDKLGELTAQHRIMCMREAIRLLST